jgi:hypothetical protein
MVLELGLSRGRAAGVVCAKAGEGIVPAGIHGQRRFAASVFHRASGSRDLGFVDLDPVAGVQDREGGDPLAVPGVEHVDADWRAPLGVAAWCGQQCQLCGRGVRKPRPHPVLLVGNDLRGGLADRQALPELAALALS